MAKTQQIKSNQVINGFRLAQNAEDLVVLEVAVYSPLEIALHPFLSTDWKYISVSKGVNNTLTIIDKNGKSKMYQINHFSSKDHIKELPVQILKLLIKKKRKLSRSKKKNLDGCSKPLLKTVE